MTAEYHNIDLGSLCETCNLKYQTSFDSNRNFSKPTNPPSCRPLQNYTLDLSSLELSLNGIAIERRRLFNSCLFNAIIEQVQYRLKRVNSVAAIVDLRIDPLTDYPTANTNCFRRPCEIHSRHM